MLGVAHRGGDSSSAHTDIEAARESLSASIALLLRLIGRDADPVRSRDYVVLSVFAEHRLRDGKPAGVTDLLADLQTPPLAEIGAMSIDDFLPKRERTSLAKALNEPCAAEVAHDVELDAGRG